MQTAPAGTSIGGEKPSIILFFYLKIKGEEFQTRESSWIVLSFTFIYIVILVVYMCNHLTFCDRFWSYADNFKINEKQKFKNIGSSAVFLESKLLYK